MNKTGIGKLDTTPMPPNCWGTVGVTVRTSLILRQSPPDARAPPLPLWCVPISVLGRLPAQPSTLTPCWWIDYNIDKWRKRHQYGHHNRGDCETKEQILLPFFGQYKIENIHHQYEKKHYYQTVIHFNKDNFGPSVVSRFPGSESVTF